MGLSPDCELELVDRGIGDRRETMAPPRSSFTWAVIELFTISTMVPLSWLRAEIFSLVCPI
jgi:hypothetical protein